MSYYDSTKDTLLHIKRVSELLTGFCKLLINRANIHDNSKLTSPEKEAFDKYTPLLKQSVYGSKEYQDFLKNLQHALDHHYKNNSHHPEHYSNGLDGFDLFDLVEMFCDWKAATERHENGSLMKSLEFNKKRFNISDQLYNILKNTIDRYYVN